MARTCVFDATETLLDLRVLDPPFGADRRPILDASTMVRGLLQSALVATVTDAYSDFGTICSAALGLVA